MIIFLDESGDLGFDFINKSPSHTFVITLLVCKNKEVLRGFKTAVNRTLKNKLNHYKNKTRLVTELKGCEIKQEIKQYFYRQLPKSGWGIYTVVLNKARVYQHLHSNKQKLYNSLARFVLEKINLKEVDSTVTLITDRCKNQREILEFNKYLQTHLEALLPLNTSLNIHHKASHEFPGLQAVDLFCSGIFRKYERKDSEWYNIFKKAIKCEEVYLTLSKATAPEAPIS